MLSAPAPAPAAPATCSALLGGSYGRLTRVCEALRVTVADASEPAEGWVTVEELMSRPDLLDAFVDAEAARIRAATGAAARRDVAASRALHHYLWTVSLLLSGPWYLERRVPRLSPSAVHIQLRTADFAVVPGDFACLPDDPAATAAGALPVADEKALRAELRAAAVEHAHPMLTALAPQLRRGQRPLWGMVGDDLVSGIWYLGRMLGEEARAVRAATELLPGPLAPFPGGADFRTLHDRTGQPHLTRTRIGCCLYYAIRPDAACLTCPRTSDAERLRRITGC